MRLYHTTTPKRAGRIIAKGFDGSRDGGHLESGFLPCVLFTEVPLEANDGWPSSVPKSIIAVDFSDEEALEQYAVWIDVPDGEEPDIDKSGQLTGEYAVPAEIANKYGGTLRVYRSEEQLDEDDKVLSERREKGLVLGYASSLARGLRPPEPYDESEDEPEDPLP
jgi:hypothetical protein